MGTIDSSGMTPSMKVDYINKEIVSEEVKKQYDDLLKKLNELMSKKPPTEEDTRLIAQYCSELKKMQDQGLETEMNNFLNLLFATFQAAGADPVSGNFNLSPSKIQAMSEEKLTIGGTTMTITEMIKTVVDPSYNPTATKGLDSMLLAFSKWGYQTYIDELTLLKDQLDAASATIEALKALQEILNMGDWEKLSDIDNLLTPKNFNELPQVIQDKLKKKFPSYSNQQMLDWIKNNPNDYKNIIDVYVKEDAMFIANPQPSSEAVMNDMIATRDKLIKQLDILKGAGAEGSAAYNDIAKVVEDLEKYVPQATYPIGSSVKSDTTWEQIITYTPSPMGPIPTFTDKWTTTIIITKADGTSTSTSSPTNLSPGEDPFLEPHDPFQDLIKEFITKGNTGTDSKINEHIDSAVNSNQNLSTKMSDEIKATNLNMQTWFDLLTQINDAWSKAKQGVASKIRS